MLLAGLLQAFFVDRLQRQRRASANTIAAYRDTFRLLLCFCQQRLGKSPSSLLVSDIDADLIVAFLHHLEHVRGNRVRTRNNRLAPIRSFFKFVALQEPALVATCQRVLAIPAKKADRKIITSLNRAEVEALLAAPGRDTWLGRRDHAMLYLLVQTGLRVSELCGACCKDIVLGSGAHVRCDGKGRKERCTPLTRAAVNVLKGWLAERAGKSDDVVFPSRRGTMLSRDAVQRLVAKHAMHASATCASLRAKTVSPHVLRHTTAVTLLQAGIDRAVIALWLGHESVETTQVYLDADLSIKERALARTAPIPAAARRFRPTDRLLTFLNGL
jgi:site-specific recombinase XerD